MDVSVTVDVDIGMGMWMSVRNGRNKNGRNVPSLCRSEEADDEISHVFDSS